MGSHSQEIADKAPGGPNGEQKQHVAAIVACGQTGQSRNLLVDVSEKLIMLPCYNADVAVVGSANVKCYECLQKKMLLTETLTCYLNGCSCSVVSQSRHLCRFMLTARLDWVPSLRRNR